MSGTKCVIYNCKDIACVPIDQLTNSKNGAVHPSASTPTCSRLKAGNQNNGDDSDGPLFGRGFCLKHFQISKKSAQMSACPLPAVRHHPKKTKKHAAYKGNKKSKKSAPKRPWKCSVYSCAQRVPKQDSTDVTKPFFCKKHMKQQTLATVFTSSPNISEDESPVANSGHDKKVCFVEGCTNTNLNTTKTFFQVPKSPTLREQWMHAANLIDYGCLSDLMHCCEDHFLYPDDFCEDSKILMNGALPRIGRGCLFVTACIDNDHAYTQLAMDTMEHVSIPIKTEPTENITDSENVNVNTATIKHEHEIMLDEIDEGEISGTEISYDTSTLVDHQPEIERLLNHMRSNSEFYLGVHPETLSILDALRVASNISTRDLLLTLRWIKLRESFLVLGFTFHLPNDDDCKNIIAENVPKIAAILRTLLAVPPRQTATIQCVVGIVQSSLLLANPYRALVSCLDDGTINFVSSAFCSQISARDLLQRSGFCDTLHATWPVVFVDGLEDDEDAMLDDRFDEIVIWNQSAGKNLPERSRFIERLRHRFVHVVRGLREFPCFKEYDSWDSDNVKLLDDAMVIAAALYNLQVITQRCVTQLELSGIVGRVIHD